MHVHVQSLRSSLASNGAVLYGTKSLPAALYRCQLLAVGAAEMFGLSAFFWVDSFARSQFSRSDELHTRRAVINLRTFGKLAIFLTNTQPLRARFIWFCLFSSNRDTQQTLMAEYRERLEAGK